MQRAPASQPVARLVATPVAEGGKPGQASPLPEVRSEGPESPQRLAERRRGAGDERGLLKRLGVAHAREDEEAPHRLRGRASEGREDRPVTLAGPSSHRRQAAPGWRLAAPSTKRGKAAGSKQAREEGKQSSCLEREDPPLADAPELRLIRGPRQHRRQSAGHGLRVRTPVGPDCVEELRGELCENELVALKPLRGELLQRGNRAWRCECCVP